jgi:hypothetical protein
MSVIDFNKPKLVLKEGEGLLDSLPFWQLQSFVRPGQRWFFLALNNPGQVNTIYREVMDLQKELPIDHVDRIWPIYSWWKRRNEGFIHEVNRLGTLDPHRHSTLRKTLIGGIAHLINHASVIELYTRPNSEKVLPKISDRVKGENEGLAVAGDLFRLREDATVMLLTPAIQETRGMNQLTQVIIGEDGISQELAKSLATTILMKKAIPNNLIPENTQLRRGAA